MSLLQNSNAIATTGGAYNITDSLRFRSSASAYLSRTPTTAGNRTTWTWSAWVKLGVIGTTQILFVGGQDANNYTNIYFTGSASGNLELYTANGGANSGYYYTPSVFRDPSSWYHIVYSVDTTAATKVTIYVNGVAQPLTISTAMSSSYNTWINSANEHRLARNAGTNTNYFDGYMTEVNFVDGQALTASDFGETNDNGVWSPKKYTGTYGTNGFYLPMKETTQATGFNTVLWTGTGVGPMSISGVGFQPDLIWVKGRNATYQHRLHDSVRGSNNYLMTHTTNAEASFSSLNIDSDGFTITALGSQYIGNGVPFVAWCWDAGSSTVSNTDGTITSSVRANPASGFSVVTYTGTSTLNASVGHGLNSAPKVTIVKNRTSAANWVYFTTTVDGSSDFLYLNLTNAKTDTAVNAPTSDVFYTAAGNESGASGNNYVAYCFSEVSGFSKFGSYTGNGSTSGPTVTTGFRPAFVMIKNTTTAQDWLIYDDARTPSNTRNKFLKPNSSDAEVTASTSIIDFTDTGFEIKGSSVAVNENGSNLIYMAFADTKDFQWNFDASGNKNNWTPNNINSNASSETTYDLMSDTPSLADEDTANFATLNPLDTTGNTLSEANLKIVANAATSATRGTISVSSGKWYWEVTNLGGTSDAVMIGISDATVPITSSNWQSSNGWYYYGFNGNKYNNATATAYGSSYTTNDVVGVALDCDAGTLTFYKNGVSQGVAYTGLTNKLLTANIGAGGATQNASANFGQRPFKYTPPTGFKKLNTFNLPDSSITDGSQYFNPVLYTGNGGTNAITGVGFEPDFVWAKSRAVEHHCLFDSVRGIYKLLYANLTNPEDNATTSLLSFNSDGFTLGSNTTPNTNGNAHVAWNWRASDSAPVSNTDGTITSTVSANPTSGFSVVSFNFESTGNKTIGHGLNAIPKMIIMKSRDSSADAWWVYHNSIGASNYLRLNSTNASSANSGVWSTTPTNQVFTIGSLMTTSNYGTSQIAYCFAEVEGFSKLGSYTGNGSADGPFVYTGFKPAFVMVKNTSTAATNWCIHDTSRKTYNISDSMLLPNDSSAELVNSAYGIDILSNGFKIKNSNSNFNTSGNNYIYMAFAEVPTKLALAR